MFFSQFPSVEYDFNRTGTIDQMVNIFRSIRPETQQELNNITVFKDFEINDGMRPDAGVGNVTIGVEVIVSNSQLILLLAVLSTFDEIGFVFSLFEALKMGEKAKFLLGISELIISCSDGIDLVRGVKGVSARRGLNIESPVVAMFKKNKKTYLNLLIVV